MSPRPVLGSQRNLQPSRGTRMIRNTTSLYLSLLEISILEGERLTDDSDSVEVILPHMPTGVLVLGMVLSIVLFLLIFRRSPNIYSAFVSLSLFSRYMASEFPHVTFKTIGGLSVISLVSLTTVFFGLFLLNIKILSSRVFILVSILIVFNFISASANGNVSAGVTSSLKWLYFFVILQCAFIAMKSSDPLLVIFSILIGIAPVVAFQLIGIPFGYAKATEWDNSVSFIGGYSHEAAFSMALMTAVIVAGYGSIYYRFFTIFFIVSFISLALGNYRTALLAVMPAVATWTLIWLYNHSDRRSRILAPIPFAMLGGLVLFGMPALEQRFSDLFVSLNQYDVLLVRPEDYSWEARRLLSSRPYIWSQYITSYFQGSDFQIILGYGPDSWINSFSVYAHNTFISTIYETGLLGALALSSIMILFATWCMLIKDRRARYYLISCHLSFFILNMGTMPLWNIEGLILYAVIVALTLRATIELPASRNYLTPGAQSKGKTMRAELEIE